MSWSFARKWLFKKFYRGAAAPLAPWPILPMHIVLVVKRGSWMDDSDWHFFSILKAWQRATGLEPAEHTHVGLTHVLQLGDGKWLPTLITLQKEKERTIIYSNISNLSLHNTWGFTSKIAFHFQIHINTDWSYTFYKVCNSVCFSTFMLMWYG